MVTKKTGFSLIELLVVIAIIAILTAIATASYTTMQKKARDGRRVSDMKAVQHAMEQSFADTGQYPGISCLPSETYLPNGLPTDPKATMSYSKVCSTTAYCFCATMEVETGNKPTNCAGTSGKFFCVYHQQ